MVVTPRRGSGPAPASARGRRFLLLWAVGEAGLHRSFAGAPNPRGAGGRGVARGPGRAPEAEDDVGPPGSPSQCRSRPPRRRRSVETPRSRPERPLDGRRGTGRDEGRDRGGMDPVVHPPHPSASPKHANRGAERRGEIGFSTSVCRNRSAGACGRARGVGSGAGWACDGVASRGSWRGDAAWTFGQNPIGGACCTIVYASYCAGL